MIRFIINRPVLVLMILAALCLLGGISYLQLPMELLMSVELPMLIVQVMPIRDADPAYFEDKAIVPLEGVISSMEGIDQIETFIEQRRTVVIVSYNQNVDIKYAYLNLELAVDELEKSVGDEFRFFVWKIDTEQLSNLFMSIQVRGDETLDYLRQLTDREIVPEFQKVDGIANVEVYGGRQRSITVNLDETTLESYNLTVSQISNIIAAGNVNRTFAGHVYNNDKQHFVTVSSEFHDPDDLGSVVIKADGPLYLKDIAEIEDGGKEETSISRVNGKRVINITLLRDPQANLISLSEETRDIIEELNKKVAVYGLDLTIQSDAAEIIQDNLDSVKQLALIGALLAIAILWIFLRNLRLVIIVAMAIPISVLVAFNAFYYFGISLNTLTLVGIGIAVGMLLDNSIVVLENIYRLLSLGRPVSEAVITGTKEVWRPVLAATMTTISVFLPFVYAESMLVQILGRHVGISIISTLIVSLAVAFLLIPAVTYRLLSAEKKKKSGFNIVSQYNRMVQLYTLLLKSCLRYPARTLIACVVLCFVSILISLALSISTTEELELSEFQMYVQMPTGTTLESADEQVLKIDEKLLDIAEVETRTANISEDQVTISFALKEDYKNIKKRDIPEIKDDIYEKLNEGFPKLEFSYDAPTSDARFRSGGGGGMGRRGGESAFMRMLGVGKQEEQVIIKGQDTDVMQVVADDIEYNLENLTSVKSVGSSSGQERPEIHLLFDHATLSHFNIPMNSIFSSMSGFQSEVSTSVKLKTDNEEIDIVLSNQDLEDKTSEDLRSIQVANTGNQMVPILQLADLLYTSGARSITRINQEQQIEINYSFEDYIASSAELLNSARQEVEQLVAEVNLPAGVAIEVVHEDTDLSQFYFLILAAMILIYMILAAVFESLTTPVVIMFTVPLATVGAFWGLIITGNSILNANAMIGFLILIGVVVNNGIILIDYIRLLKKRGYRHERALLVAGQARVRPILITAMTTVIAMLPLAMGKAEYVSKIGAPFPIAVIGGLTFGTIFTLVFIPTAYSALENVLRWWKKLPWAVKIIQILIFIFGCYLIYVRIDSKLWQVGNLVLLTAAIPGATYFMRTSLRRASKKLIPADIPIRIEIRNVMKNYNDFSRFVKELRKRERQLPRLLQEFVLQTRSKLTRLLMHLPIYSFLFYFTFIYLEGNFWLFVLAQIYFIYTLYLTRLVLNRQLEAGENQTQPRDLNKWLYRFIYWIVPLLISAYYYYRWENISLVIIVAVVWYLILLIYSTSEKIQRTKMNIHRVSGRFRRLRGFYYRQVVKIPIVGKRKIPFRALDHISLNIGSGMFGLIGPNGAGKTTLMRIICGILDQSSGTIKINDFNIREYREELQGLIGYLPQEFGTYGNMTAEEFLDYQAMLKGIWNKTEREDIVNKVIKAVHLDENRKRKIKSFSGGMRQRIGIAQTLLHLPRILVVDEPTAGLDPRERIRFRNLLSELAKDRIVIFSTHIIEDISSSCNKLAVLNQGRVQFEGTPEGMAELCQGNVWQANVSEQQFNELRKQFRVVHHIRSGEFIRVRMLSKEKPMETAETVLPTLEDSYLWLLEKSKVKKVVLEGADHV